MVSYDYIAKERSIVGPMMIACSGIMWGSLGIFGSLLIRQGIPPSLIGCFKLLVSSLLLFLYFLHGKTEYLKIKWRDLGWLLLMAFMTQTVFNFSYHTVVKELGVAKAGILLYTMPIFLIIWSVLFFKEKLNHIKILGCLLCVLGSIVALTGGRFDVSSFTFNGIVLGLIAALSFSLMSVFCKILLKRMRPLTVIFYAFLFGGLMMLPFVDVMIYLPQIMTIQSVGSIIGIALIGSVLPYITYFKGIDMGVELSQAGVISVLELVTSIILATFILGEHLNGVKVMGIVSIVIAILVIQKGNESPSKQ